MDQISRWKQLASLKEYKDPQAAKCLKAVELGFNKCIRLPRKLKGRPRVSITNELKEYPRIVKELDNIGLGNRFLQELRKLQKDKPKNRQEFQQQLNNRINELTEFSKKKKIKLTQAEIKKLVWVTTSKIALHLIAKRTGRSPITIKRRLAKEFPRFNTINVLGYTIPVSKKRTPRKLKPSRNKTPKI